MLHYERIGAGEVLVLVHGFLGGNTIFSKVIERLQQHFDVIRIDLPGHGKSAMERVQYSVYDYAEAIAEVLKHEYVEKAYWLGHSMGGYITLAALEKNLAPITKVVLAYSSDASDTDEAKEKRTEQQENLRQDGVKPLVDRVIAAFFADDAREEDIQFAKEVAYAGTEDGLIAALQAMKERPDQRDFLQKISTPILLLQGSEDKIVKPIELGNSNIKKVITKTGHLGMLEDPDAFVNAVVGFLK
ncbi:alpha/beta fold hydrolase [Solibacillus sp. FSL H8-0538]|uniref:alpha/beta fold hydrolase n=1 Tax=Solibacillus sp. FSL H8-0538 TaxID=2921400 RepID=UPI0030F5AC95